MITQELHRLRARAESVKMNRSRSGPLAIVLPMFQHPEMSRRRFAIITYDPDRIEQLSWQGEGNCFAYIIWRGLSGWTYPKERGIINITLMDQSPAKDHPTIDRRDELTKAQGAT